MEKKLGISETNMMPSHSMFSVPSSAEFTGGLMRYHSAPHSVISGLLDEEDSDFEKLLDDGGMGSFSSLLDMKPIDKSLSNIPMDVSKEEAYLGQQTPAAPQYITSTSFQEQLSQTPLSIIHEHVIEEPLDKYCNPQLPGVSQQISQSTHVNRINNSSPNSSLHRDLWVNSTSQRNTGLIRQSSSPAVILSRIAAEEAANVSPKVPKMGGLLDGQQRVSVHNQATQNFGSQGFQSPVQPLPGSRFTETMSSGRLPPPSRTNILLRQSSSPAGLLSELAFDEMALTSPSGSHLLRSGWDNSATDMGDHAFGLRKRGRGLNERMLMNNLQKNAVDDHCSPNSFMMPSSSNFDMEGSALDPLLCKARAKRGFATHPRSIAERVRRTKISERIKKLQDLVPNLDKQSSTAEMLDEVVEYVKLLQQQVQELSMKQPHCNGSCKKDRKVHS